MTVKEGDLIRFLNATGGGTVTRIDPHSSTIYVRDETGFEIPVRSSEVVVVTEGSTIVPKVETRTISQSTPIAQKPSKTKEKDVRPRDLRHLGSVNATLCYMPEEGKKLGEGNFEAFIVNDSQYDLIVVYTSGSDNAERELRYYGIIPFDSIELIDVIPAGTDLDRRTRSSFVLIPIVEEGRFARKEAFTIELKIEGGKFYKAGAYVDNDYFEDKAILYDLVRDDRPYLAKRINPDLLADRMMAKESAPEQSRESRARKGARREVSQRRKNEPIVIDLHASELLETTAGMDAKAILEYQLEEVRRVMKAHRRPIDKGDKIIFIHGKGEGVLREAVISLIRKEFPRCTVQDASFQEYGFGASQVTIH